MKKLLITGGAGFIGANFVHYWHKHNPQDSIVVLDVLTYAGSRSNLDGLDNIDFYEGNILNEKLIRHLLLEHEIDTLVHFAAESHVDRSISGPDAFIETNVLGTHALLKAARSVWLSGSGKPHRFHHVSTDEVYGSLRPAERPFSETTPYAPNSPYSASKAASDHLVRAYHHTYGLQTTTSNCSNNYGPFQFPEKLIPLFLINALHGRNLPIYGDGLNVRDWLFVEDHCRGIELVLNAGRIGETYNIGGRAELPNMAVVDMLCASIDRAFAEDASLAQRFPAAPPASGKATSDLKIFVTDRPGHDRRYAIDAKKAHAELGYTPAHSFEAGFVETVNWYLAHESWWRDLMFRSVK